MPTIFSSHLVPIPICFLPYSKSTYTIISRNFRNSRLPMRSLQSMTAFFYFYNSLKKFSSKLDYMLNETILSLHSVILTPLLSLYSLLIWCVLPCVAANRLLQRWFPLQYFITFIIATRILGCDFSSSTAVKNHFFHSCF